MNTVSIHEAIQHWSYVAPLFVVPKDEADYEQLVDALDTVLEDGGEDENHPLASLADKIADLLEQYETQHQLISYGTGIDALKFFMETHNIKQNQLPEIGSQGVVSEILSGKRQLNLRQIKKLAARFGVTEQVFI